MGYAMYCSAFILGSIEREVVMILWYSYPFTDC